MSMEHWRLGQLARGNSAAVKIAEGLIEQFGDIDLPSVEGITPIIPEGAIRLPDLTIGGKTPKQLERALASGGFRVSDNAVSLLRSKDFTTLLDQQTLSLVRVKVSDLGLTGNPTTDQVYAKARSFGLELCPAEAGPQLRLACKDQPLNEWLFVGMEQITDPDVGPSVFKLDRGEDGSCLHGRWAYPGHQWNPKDEFVFSLRK